MKAGLAQQWLVVKQALRSFNRRRLARRRAARTPGYAEWIVQHEAVAPAVMQARLAAIADPPLLSVVTPDGQAPAWLARQSYPRHECVAPGQAQGDYLLFPGPQDQLAEHALLLLAEAARRFPQARLIYADDDLVDDDGQRHDPWFKPDWDADLAQALDLPGPCAAWARGTAPEAAATLATGEVVHVPHVLGHRRADARPQPRPVPVPPLPTPLPRVSILIPTRNQVHLLRTCIESLGAITDYPDLELIVIDNGSDEPGALAYLAALRTRPGVQVLPMPLRPFNFSALNNRAAEQARGELLLLLNNDIEVIEPHWLRAMVAQALRPGVGAVGARLLYPDRTLQHGGVVLGLGRDGVATPAFKGLPLAAPGAAGRAQCLQSFSAVTAACLLVRKSVYQQVGGLEEAHLAVAYNDVDFCLKLRAAGLRNLWTPQATLIHHESVSRGRDATAANSDRFAKEAAWMRERWGAALRDDPAYNPNLNGLTGDFALAEAPRVSLARPWFLR